MSDVALWGRGIIACVFISGADAAVAALICLISDRKPAWDNTQAVKVNGCVVCIVCKREKACVCIYIYMMYTHFLKTSALIVELQRFFFSFLFFSL